MPEGGYKALQGRENWLQTYSLCMRDGSVSHLPSAFCKVAWLALLASQLPERGQLIFTARRALKSHIQLNSDGCLGQAFSLHTSFFSFTLCVFSPVRVGWNSVFFK